MAVFLNLAAFIISGAIAVYFGFDAISSMRLGE